MHTRSIASPDFSPSLGKSLLTRQTAERIFSFVQKGNCDERVGQLACVSFKKKDTARAVSLPTSNLIYLFSLSDPAPNSLRCATGRAALAAATAGIAAAAPYRSSSTGTIAP